MSDPQTTRPDPVGPDGWPFVERTAVVPAKPMGVVRRILQAFVSIVGVQFLAVAAVALVLGSYRRIAAEWLLPLIGAVDLLITLQIGWLAIRDIRLAGRRTTGPRVALLSLVAVFLAGAGVAGHMVHRYVERPVAAAFDTPAHDRDIRITASAPECGRTAEGITVRGVMCRVLLTAANTGSAKARFAASRQRLRGEDAEYPGLLFARGARTEMVWTLDAGASVRGYLVFDVPRAFRPRSLDLHAAKGSKGLRIPVPAR